MSSKLYVHWELHPSSINMRMSFDVPLVEVKVFIIWEGFHSLENPQRKTSFRVCYIPQKGVSIHPTSSNHPKSPECSFPNDFTPRPRPRPYSKFWGNVVPKCHPDMSLKQSNLVTKVGTRKCRSLGRYNSRWKPCIARPVIRFYNF